jgi:hypothetical protein
VLALLPWSWSIATLDLTSARGTNTLDAPAVCDVLPLITDKGTNPRPSRRCGIQYSRVRFVVRDGKLGLLGKIPDRGSALLAPHSIRLAVEAAHPLEFTL